MLSPKRVTVTQAAPPSTPLSEHQQQGGGGRRASFSNRVGQSDGSFLREASTTSSTLNIFQDIGLHESSTNDEVTRGSSRREPYGEEASNLHVELERMGRGSASWRAYMGEPKNIVRVIVLLLVGFAVIFGAVKGSGSPQMSL